MKILHIASEYPPQKVFGLGRFVHGLARAQAARGDEVHVVTNSLGGRDHDVDDDGVRVHRVDFPPPPKPADSSAMVTQFNIQAYERVMADGLGEGVEVVNGHDWLTSMVSHYLARQLGAKLVVTIHDVVVGKRSGNLDNDAKFAGNIEHWICREADSILAVSRHTREELVSTYGASPEKVHAIHNAVDADSFPSVPADELATFRQVLAAPDESVILYVGRLDREKGVDVLLSAFAEVADRFHSRLVIAGKGELGEQLMRQAKELGVADRTDFVGYIQPPVLNHLIRCADVQVVPSLYEPFGIVALEAMVCARPLVASATGGLREIVTEGKDGLLTPPGDVQALARTLAELLGDVERRTALGAAAVQTVRERFSWETVAASTAQVLAQPPEAGPEPSSHQTAMEAVRDRTRLRVTIDGRMALGHNGTAVYTRRLVAALRQNPALDVSVLGYAAEWDWLPDLRTAVAPAPRFLDGEWEQTHLPPVIAATSPDVFLSPMSCVPAGLALPCISIVHDIAFEHHPEFYPAQGLLPYLKHWMPRFCETATHVIAVSEHTRSDILATYGIPPRQVGVVYPGPGILPGTDVSPIPCETRRHVLSVSSGGRNKNLPLLLLFHQRLRKHAAVPLIVVGPPELAKQARELPGPSLTDVEFRHDLTDEALADLHRHALLYVHTSLWEGFGFPIAEAMACGTPIVAVGAGAVPEVVGSAGSVVSPEKLMEEAPAAGVLVDTPDAWEEGSLRCLEEAQRFSWAQCATEVAGVLHRVVRQHVTVQASQPSRPVVVATPPARRHGQRRGRTVCTIAYNEPSLIEHWLSYYYPVADELIVAYGRVQGYPEVADDDTAQRVLAFPDPERKLTLVRRPLWPHKMAMQNAYLDLATNDLIFRPDCDEFIDDLPGLEQTMRERDLPAAGLRWQTYYRTADQLIEGSRFDIFPMRAFRNLPGFRFRRHFDELIGPNNVVLAPHNCAHVDTVLHHYGYAKPLAEMRAKHLYYRQRGDAAHADAKWFTTAYPTDLGPGVGVVDFDPDRHTPPVPRALADELRRAWHEATC